MSTDIKLSKAQISKIIQSEVSWKTPWSITKDWITINEKHDLAVS